MKGFLFATAVLSLAAVSPASAQMAGQPMMGMGSGQSCVMNGQFVPCPPGGGMQPGMMQGGMMQGGMTNQGAGMGGGMSGGMAAQDPNMNRPMTAAERRRAARQQGM
jgi:hypothetical protein